MRTPVEVTTSFVTSVATLPEAWAFVMERIDSVGGRPTVSITPKSIYAFADIAEGEGQPLHLFEVVVRGMQEESSS